MKIVEYKFNTSNGGFFPTFNSGFTYDYSDTTNSDGTTTRVINTKNNSTVGPTSMSFKNKTKLIHIGYADFSSLESASEMFRNCSNLVSVDASEWKFGDINDLSHMFDSCSRLPSINLDNLSTAGFNDISYMFANCISLNDVSLKNWNALNLSRTNNMFYFCDVLRLVDLSTWRNAKLHYVQSMFTSCTNLETVDLSNIQLDIQYDDYKSNMFKETNVKNLIMANCSIETIDTIIPVLNTRTQSSLGNLFISVDPIDIDTISLSQKYWNTYKTIVYYQSASNGLVPTFNSGYSYSSFNISDSVGGTTKYRKVIYNSSNTAPTSISFQSTNVLEIYYMNTENLTSTKNMFASCTSLTNVNMAEWNMTNVTDTSYMFNGCTKLVSVSGMDTLQFNNLTNTSYMFQNCSSLDKINGINKWNVTTITNASYMFKGCSKVYRINLSNLDLSNATITNIFSGTTNLYRLMVCGTTDASVNKIIDVLINKSSSYNGILYTNNTLSKLNVSTGSSKYWVVQNPGVIISYAFRQSDGTCMLPVFNKGFNEYEYEDLMAGSYIVRKVYKFDASPTYVSLRDDPNVRDVLSIDFTGIIKASSLLSGCVNLKTLNLTNVDVSSIEDMYGMFRDCTNLTFVNITGWDTSNVTDMGGMFRGCTKLKEIRGISDLNVNNVERFSELFYNCTSLESVDLSSWNTGNAIELHGMFKGCNLDVFTGIETLNVSSAKDLNNIFASTKSEKILNLSRWNVVAESVNEAFLNANLLGLVAPNWIIEDDEPSTVRSIFGNANIGSIDIPGWNLLSFNRSSYIFNNCNCDSLNVSDWTFGPYCTSLSGLFWGCYASIIDISTWTIEGTVTAVTNMFAYSRVTDIIGLNGNIINSSVTDMSGLFEGCYNLTSIDTSDWDCSNVERASGIFMDCRVLSSIDISNCGFTSNLISAHNLFRNCKAATSINITGLSLRRASDIYNMFQGCEALESIIGIEKMDCSSATSFNNMFKGCKELTNIDLSQWTVTDSVKTMTNMFADCTSLDCLNLSSWNISTSASLTNIFTNTNAFNNFRAVNVNDSVLNMFIDALITKSNTEPGCMYIDNELDNINYNTALTKFWAVENNTLVVYYGYNKAVDVLPTFNSEFTDYTYATEVGYDKNTRKVYTFETDFTSMNMRSTALVDVFYLNTKSMSSQSGFFSGASNLETVDLTGWDSSRISSFTTFFKNCSKLRTITGINDIDTSSVTTLYQMFDNCSSLETLDLSKWDVSNVTNMSGTFSACSSLTALNLKGWNPKLTTATSIFRDCSSLTSIVGLNTFDVSGSTSFASMFNGCSSLETIPGLSSWNTVALKTLTSTFANCTSLLSLDISGWNLESVTTTSVIFSGSTLLNGIIMTNCSVTSINKLISLLHTRSADAPGTIYTNADTTNIDTATALSKYWTIELASIIANYRFLLETDTLPAFNSGYTGYSYSDTVISDTEIERTVFATPDNLPTTISFSSKKALTEVFYLCLDNVTSLSFNGCTSLFNVDTTNWNMNKITSLSGAFRSCSALVEIDLGTLDFSSVTNISGMFASCANLKTVDFSGIQNATNTGNMNAMFQSCPSLTTVIGLDRFSPFNIGNMFYGCSSLTELDLSCWYNTPITTIASAFANCSGLKTINVGGLKITASSFASIFSGCSSLTNIIGMDTWDTSQSPAAAFTTTFSNCASLKSIDLSGWHVAVTSKSCKNMFSGCTALTKLDLSGWEFSDATASNFTPFNNNTSLNVIIMNNCSDASVNMVISVLPTKTSSDMGYLCVDSGHETTVDYTTANSLYWYLSSPTLLTRYRFDPSIDTIPTFSNNYATYYVKDSMINNTNLIDREVYIFNSTPTSVSFKAKSGLVDLLYFDASGLTSLNQFFINCTSLKRIDMSALKNVNNVTNIGSMFTYCSSLENISNMGSFVTSKITTLSSMFSGCTKLKTVDMSNWNTSNVTTIASLFNGCKALTSVDLSNLNLQKVTSLASAFTNCTALTTITGTANLNVGNVTSMASMFSNCVSLQSIDLSGWNTAKVTNMSSLFSGCSSLKSVNLNNWDTTKVTNLSSMFKGCGMLENVDINNFVLYNVTNLKSVFENCSSLSTLNLSNVCTKKVTAFDNMFKGCVNLSTLNISGWYINTSATIGELFTDCIKLNKVIADKIPSNMLNKLISAFETLEESRCSVYTNNVYDVNKGDAYYKGYDIVLSGIVNIVNNKRTCVANKKVGNYTGDIKIHVGSKSI